MCFNPTTQYTTKLLLQKLDHLVFLVLFFRTIQALFSLLGFYTFSHLQHTKYISPILITLNDGVVLNPSTQFLMSFFLWVMGPHLYYNISMDSNKTPKIIPFGCTLITMEFPSYEPSTKFIGTSQSHVGLLYIHIGVLIHHLTTLILERWVFYHLSMMINDYISSIMNTHLHVDSRFYYTFRTITLCDLTHRFIPHTYVNILIWQDFNTHICVEESREIRYSRIILDLITNCEEILQFILLD